MINTLHKNALPNYAMLLIDERKLTAYALDVAHTVGKDLAEKFRSVLGFDNSNWKELSDQISEKVPDHEAVLLREDIHGSRFRVDLPIIGANGNIAIVRTVWIILNDTESPMLDTLRVLPQEMEPGHEG